MKIFTWFALWTCTIAAYAAPLPNIVIINIDDLGYGDIHPFGSPTPTPHLDRMAREGRRLLAHYAAPVCSPSRASLMTGCYPKRVLPVPHVLFPASPVGLHPDELTLAKVAKASGYATTCIGKWHLGDQPDFLPTRQGFDSYFGIPYSNDMGPAADGAKSNLGAPVPKPRSAVVSTNEQGRLHPQPPLPLLENEKVVERVTAQEQQTLTRRFTERAVRFIRDHRDQPFLIYLPHAAVHFPLYPSRAFLGRSGRGLYPDWVQEVDASVGEVLETLRELKLDRRTLVIFTSDNGGSIPHGASNQPLRGSKGSTWEGGIRVPTIAWWPGKIPAGTSTDAITSMMDLLPTIAGLVRQKLPSGRKSDGHDILPVLTRARAKSPTAVFFYYRGLTMEAVRDTRWKLHLGSGELYDLQTDIGESVNVAAAHPMEVAKLRRAAEGMVGDLGMTGMGPGCRPLGRVAHAEPLLR